MALLRVIAGPDRGRTAEVDEAPVSIGRGDDCGLCLTDEQVSVIHAVVEPTNNGCRVRDLESTNGTAVNGHPVSEHRLMFGDTITVGQTVILYGSGEEAVGSETVGSAEAPGPGDSDIP
ncbi:MAG: FHA domain-containing protein [Planctomycetota bacterium]